MPRLTTTITICSVDCPETTEPAYRTVTFTLADYGTEATYAWDFGDGDTDETSTNEVTHVYAASGSYEVSVVVTTELGEQGSAIDCAVEVQGCLPHPTAVWEFAGEDGTSATGAYDLTVTGVTYGPGKIDTAPGFDNDSLAEIPGSNATGHPMTRQPGTSFTLALWILPSALAYADAGGGIAACNGETPLNKGDVIFSHAHFEYCLQFYQPAGGTINDTHLLWLLSDGSDVGTGVGVIDLGHPAVGQWHFVVVGYDDSVPTPFGKINNGTLQTYAPYGHDAALTKNKTFKLGASAASGGDHHFQGSIDNCAFWKCVLTEAEMQTLYNSGAGLAYPFTG